MLIGSQASMAVAFFAAMASVCWSAAYVWGKWLDRRGRSDPHDTQRLERIEQALDTVAIEVERLGEHQRFVARMVQQHSLPPSSPSEDYRVNTPH